MFRDKRVLNYLAITLLQLASVQLTLHSYILIHSQELVLKVSSSSVQGP